MKAEDFFSIINAINSTIINTNDILWELNKKVIPLLAILLGILLILGIVIIINQIRIRKQLRRIQDQLDATFDKNSAGGDNQGE